MFAVAFHKTHGKNNTRKFDTEVFVPVASLNGVVRSPSLFIRSLIFINGKIWFVVYINEKWIYAPKNLACTIIEFAILRNILHVTLTCTLISWCYGDANLKWTPQVWNSPLKYAEVNCVPASDENTSKYQQPIFSIVPDIYWNISNSFITYSVVILCIP